MTTATYDKFSPQKLAMPLSKRIAKAKRRTLLVKALHILLPASLITFIFANLIINVANRIVPQLPFKTDGLVVNGSKLSMVSPNLSGYLKDNRNYKLRAERAEQDLKTPKIIDLYQMRADVDLTDGGVATLIAIEGTMETEKELITFKKQVTVQTTSGHFAKTSEALVDAKAGLIIAPNAVELKSPTGEMTADRMEIRDRGKYMLFEGSVKGFFIPSNAETSTTDTPELKEEKP